MLEYTKTYHLRAIRWRKRNKRHLKLHREGKLRSWFLIRKSPLNVDCLCEDSVMPHIKKENWEYRECGLSFNNIATLISQILMTVMRIWNQWLMRVILSTLNGLAALTSKTDILWSWACRIVQSHDEAWLRKWVCLQHDNYPQGQCDDVCSNTDVLHGDNYFGFHWHCSIETRGVRIVPSEKPECRSGYT